MNILEVDLLMKKHQEKISRIYNRLFSASSLNACYKYKEGEKEKDLADYEKLVEEYKQMEKYFDYEVRKGCLFMINEGLKMQS